MIKQANTQTVFVKVHSISGVRKYDLVKVDVERGSFTTYQEAGSAFVKGAGYKVVTAWLAKHTESDMPSALKQIRAGDYTELNTKLKLVEQGDDFATFSGVQL